MIALKLQVTDTDNEKKAAACHLAVAGRDELRTPGDANVREFVNAMRQCAPKRHQLTP
jgi:hypothetical protein